MEKLKINFQHPQHLYVQRSPDIVKVLSAKLQTLHNQQKTDSRELSAEF